MSRVAYRFTPKRDPEVPNRKIVDALKRTGIVSNLVSEYEDLQLHWVTDGQARKASIDREPINIVVDHDVLWFREFLTGFDGLGEIEREGELLEELRPLQSRRFTEEVIV